MLYYLLLENDEEKDVYYDANILGDESFGMFYPESGFFIFKRLVDTESEVLEDIRIFDEKKNPYTISEFIDKLEQWKIKKP